jgi:hypothetical protein
MSEPVARIALAAGATALALGIAPQAAPPNAARRDGPLQLDGIAGRLVLFTAADCRRVGRPQR